jgi:hypothetical protein
MINVGLYISDLPAYDGTGQMIVTGSEYRKTLHQQVKNEHDHTLHLENKRRELNAWKKKSKNDGNS